MQGLQEVQATRVSRQSAHEGGKVCQPYPPAGFTPPLSQEIILVIIFVAGRDSSVGIATRYGLDGLGIESRWWRDFQHTSRPTLGLTQSPIQWVPGHSRGESGRGVELTTHPI
jgi:hypothetical protein